MDTSYPFWPLLICAVEVFVFFPLVWWWTGVLQRRDEEAAEALQELFREGLAERKGKR